MSSPISFQAIRIFEEDGKFEQRIVERSTEDLPEGEVLIQVHYSSLNYKDALSASGNRGVTRNYPHTPGVDASGIVADSTVAAAGVEVDTNTFAIREPLLAGQQAGALQTSLSLGASVVAGATVRVVGLWVHAGVVANDLSTEA